MLFPPSFTDFTITELRAIRASLSEPGVNPAIRVMAHGLVAALLVHAHARDIWGWGAYSYAVSSAQAAARPSYSLHTMGPDGPVVIETMHSLEELIAATDQYAAADPKVDLWTTDDASGLVRVYIRGKRA